MQYPGIIAEEGCVVSFDGALSAIAVSKLGLAFVAWTRATRWEKMAFHKLPLWSRCCPAVVPPWSLPGNRFVSFVRAWLSGVVTLVVVRADACPVLSRLWSSCHRSASPSPSCVFVPLLSSCCPAVAPLLKSSCPAVVLSLSRSSPALL